MKKSFPVSILAALFLAVSAFGQYSPPGTLKKAYDSALKKADDALAKAKSQNNNNSVETKVLATSYEDLNKRWDAVKANATAGQKDNVAEAKIVIATYLFTIPGQTNSAGKNIEVNEALRKSLVANEAKATTDQEYMDVVKAASSLQASCSANQKVTAQVVEMRLDLAKNLDIYKAIVVALESNEEDEGEETSSPYEVLSALKNQAETNQGVFAIIAEAYEGEPENLQDAYNEVMAAWYWFYFEDPMGLTEAEAKTVSECVNDIWAVQMHVQSSVSMLQMNGMMWEGMLTWAESQTDPWLAIDAYFWFAANADAEYYETLGDLIAFAYERQAQALAILE